MAEIVRDKYDFDVVGHYARSDVFQLLVNERETPALVAACEDSQTFKKEKNDSAGESKNSIAWSVMLLKS